MSTTKTNRHDLASLYGLKAIVTGGTSGIGAAVTEQFAHHGVSVGILDLTPDSAAAASPRIHSYTVDLRDDSATNQAVRDAVRDMGGLDIVVNNAGIGAEGTVEDNIDEQWRCVLDVNVQAVARVTRAALPYLRKSDHAAIVNTCSIAATVGLPNRVLYSASKGAVYSMTLAMAADHIHEGIRVNCVNPGTADTPWIDRLLASADDPAAEKAALEARQPSGRLIQAEEIASTIVFLASPAASGITGSAVAVDGGMQGLRLRPPNT